MHFTHGSSRLLLPWLWVDVPKSESCAVCIPGNLWVWCGSWLFWLSIFLVACFFFTVAVLLVFIFSCVYLLNEMVRLAKGDPLSTFSSPLEVSNTWYHVVSIWGVPPPPICLLDPYMGSIGHIALMHSCFLARTKLILLFKLLVPRYNVVYTREGSVITAYSVL